MMTNQRVMDNSVRMSVNWQPLTSTPLPIFRQNRADDVLFYAPGYLAVVRPDRAAAFEADLSAAPGRESVSAKLRRRAVSAQQQWADALNHPFAPLCLTLYLNNECNLHCTYCFAMPSAGQARRLSPEGVRAAAEQVAIQCSAQGRPFTLVFHGGGEPTLDQAFAGSILDVVEQVAAAHGLPMFRYVATNGVMSAEKAAWLAARFDLIGLSCDGPAAIQAAQRPLRGGASSAPYVERTAQIVRDSGRMLHVRVTVTHASLTRQAEIAEYLCQHIKPQEIHIEPVYRVGRAKDADEMSEMSEIDEAGAFVGAFLEGRAVAMRYGIPWLTSGSRPAEIHGPYCQVYRDVLNLVPGDVATACLKLTEAESVRQHGLLIGGLDGAGFVLDQARIGTLRQVLRADPLQCATCFNRYHCVRGCPESCPLDQNTPFAEFRCRVQHRLTDAYVQEAAERLRVSPTDTTGITGGEINSR
jgi:sulfatase maturation enzyme AslB (radical SAM superfamily)